VTRGLLARGRAALYRLGPVAPTVRTLRPRALVLAYHRVARVSFDPFRLAVSPERFEAHLAVLRRRFTIVSLPELVAGLRGGRYRDGSVAITFDDGYEDNASAAYPIAARMGAPMTVFATVDPMLSGSRFWWDDLALRTETEEERSAFHRDLKALPADARRRRLDQLPVRQREALGDVGRPMTTDELREFAGRPGVTIGAHTMTHPSLGCMPASVQAEEWTRSRQALEAMLARPVSLAAYPFGRGDDVTDLSRQAARGAAYAAAFTTVHEVITPGKPLHALPRLTVYDWPEAEFSKRVDALFRAA
jgi:peptidoglycan/xylan/chitin deacetylase (PgdA/CDA1 family)